MALAYSSLRGAETHKGHRLVLVVGAFPRMVATCFIGGSSNNCSVDK